MTAEAGAGIYLTERRALVEALHHLLQLHALPDADAAKDIQSAVDSFVESLLSETSGGRSIMIARLVELIGVSIITHHCLNLTSSLFGRFASSNILPSSSQRYLEGQLELHNSLPQDSVPPQDDNLEPQPGARLTAVVDDRGALVERQTLVMAERTLLCEVGMLFPCNFRKMSNPLL